MSDSVITSDGPAALAVVLSDATGINSSSVSIVAPTGGGMAISNQTIRIITNAIDGYNAQLSAAGSQTAMT
ncbi:MAG: hypothetical protein Q4C83_02105, partial [Candidatus Saccharibacteria bacterium]|nr:hypothetical protein [Candidatus Saccharibacteria bacterium]